ncbi:MAG: hypothetical protein A3A98_01285 [Candidatus Staskawiczbacteria bacterium RIFCSPLOWO2_01_FULL_40_39]|uniref:Uncharacterized protein n=1 Tax=Candidatus Staskawiczbacteria bacterium RIFCSPHIGHO2_01_FULL_39_25 TaxID=1802202 RepID=A0A1G2HN93_9BACT|nr:MAG: hypothetical protein A2730_01285 [Candidatus Staskawiczbacteria bacterium RIFCSPHIGHO2_01_FULL_39_25]OGZ73361.1 MAG: hypothetical protein A3A98_01285 [Candidatus Staskawiczbacteria bacterium RIFCSPLOWO2_01_FULL_40_39]
MVKKILEKNFQGTKKAAAMYLHKIKKIPWILGYNAFFFMLIFILLDLIFGEILLYNYIVSVNLKDHKFTYTPAKFHEETYQSVVNKWQAREDIFKNSDQENYRDPFQ